MNFKFRSYQKEFLDEQIIPTKDLHQNLTELHTINHYLGGYKVSIKGLSEILNRNKSVNTVLDIGFGGGDAIKKLSNYFHNQNPTLFFYGVDLKNDCFAYATQNLITIPNKKLICSDYRNISAELLKKTDVIHCSLFVHHLTDDEIIELFHFAKKNDCILLVNDLHRNWLAYYSIKFLTILFSKSYLVKNDAPLSVLRGFKKNELIQLVKQAGYSDFSVNWSWAFRYTVIAYA
jgi:2-polyprenyl-3-methyl-5-hydroxy-6-metoxy-1,4-benzoquinol methylase